jgi:branched-chain amino acid transport system substrate-binding protein
VEEMEVSSATIFKPLNDDSAIAVSQAFRDKMIQLTGNPDVIVSPQDFDPNNDDFRTQLRTIRNSGAEVVFMPSGIDDAAEILIQAREVGVRAVFLGTSNWENPELIEKAGEAAEGITFSTIFDPEAGITETTEIFLRAYREKYGEDAVPSGEVALAFDAYLVAVDAIERAGTPLVGSEVARALARTKEFPGASGSITFDEKGDPIKSVVMKTVLNGEIVLTYTVEPNWVDIEEEEEGED